MIEEEFIEQEEKIQEPSLVSRIVRWLIAVAVLVGLVYLSGLDQYFFYQRTPVEVQQQKVESAVDAQTLTVPLTVFILRNQEANGSERTMSEVEVLVREASKIWEQASINLHIKNIYTVEKTDKELEGLLDSYYALFQSIEGFDSSTINVFLLARLRGINGIAFGGSRAVAVADYTSVYDFRALAHEVGHVLGLSHIQNPLQLMHSGANGFDITLQEILKAREQALRF